MNRYNAFMDLESTGERKVQIFMTRIADSRLESAKNQMFATPALKAMFETPWNFLAEGLLDNKVSLSASNCKQPHISTVQTMSKGQGKKWE